jgi:hypothetical protein
MLRFRDPREQEGQITVQLPDDLAEHTNPGREALEDLEQDLETLRKLQLST